MSEVKQEDFMDLVDAITYKFFGKNDDSNEKLYKVLGVNHRVINGGKGFWPEIGSWTAERPVSAGLSGWHLCRYTKILEFISEDYVHIYEAEGIEPKDELGDSIAFSKARLTNFVGYLDARNMRLLAVMYARRTLPLVEEKERDNFGGDILDIAEKFAIGKISRQKMAYVRKMLFKILLTAEKPKYVVYSAIYSTLLQRPHKALVSSAWDSAWAISWSAIDKQSKMDITKIDNGNHVWDEAWSLETNWQLDRLFEMLQK